MELYLSYKKNHTKRAIQFAPRHRPRLNLIILPFRIRFRECISAVRIFLICLRSLWRLTLAIKKNHTKRAIQFALNLIIPPFQIRFRKCMFAVRIPCADFPNMLTLTMETYLSYKKKIIQTSQKTSYTICNRLADIDQDKNLTIPPFRIRFRECPRFEFPARIFRIRA